MDTEDSVRMQLQTSGLREVSLLKLHLNTRHLTYDHTKKAVIIPQVRYTRERQHG